MNHGVLSSLTKLIRGEVSDNLDILKSHSRDASIFEVTPELVIFPKDKEDLESLVSFVSKYKSVYPELSLTPRAAGTCMSGGTLTSSISVDMKNFNKVIEVGNDFAIVEPGTYYRDFEKETLARNLILPPYPSSRLLCSVGGMVANNAGGEKSLEVGKTEKYVNELQMILRDGKEYTFKKLTKQELDKKIEDYTIEGDIYKEMYSLLDKNYDLVKSSKPNVSKNSSGYNIWDIWNKETFDLSQIFIGAQGTLGINTRINFKLVPVKKETGMLIIYMKNFDNIPTIVKKVLSYHPGSFESFDDYTLNLALKYVSDFAPVLHTSKLHAALEFMPEFLMKFENKMPKLALIVEFEGNETSEIEKNINSLKNDLSEFANIHTKIAKNIQEEDKEWAIRRESFNLLRQKLVDLKAAPFIDDTCVNPEALPEFLPKLYKILDDNKLIYSIAGHIGNGNFHIFPLLDLRKQEERDRVFVIAKQVFDLVFEYKGSTTGEHNDGLARTPFVKDMFSPEIYKIFEEVKNIFDPDNIFNPGKKVNGSLEFAKEHIIKNW